MPNDMNLDAPGIYDIPMAEYLADPCPVPSLTGSGVKALIHTSPLHCWYGHPRLGGASGAPTAAMDAGSIVHDLVFEDGGSAYVPLDFPDWRTKAAQAARDDAWEAGKIPVLAAKLAELQECAAVIRQAMREIPAVAASLAAGKPERTMIWREGDAWCRARPDWLPDDPRLPMLNLKTTGMSASPEARERDIRDGHALSAAFYERGAEKLRGVRPAPTLFIMAETDPPFGISVLAAAPEMGEMAEEDVEGAIREWTHLLATHPRGTPWPGYPTHTHWVEPPPWMAMRRAEGQLRRTQARDTGAQYQRLMAAAGGGPIR